VKGGVEASRVNFKGFIDVVQTEVKAARKDFADRAFARTRRAAEPVHMLKVMQRTKRIHNWAKPPNDCLRPTRVPLVRAAARGFEIGGDHLGDQLGDQLGEGVDLTGLFKRLLRSPAA
jgi:hypothetical protein